ncbi:thermonuclease family protein [Homoserinimonas sp. A447]
MRRFAGRLLVVAAIAIAASWAFVSALPAGGGGAAPPVGAAPAPATAVGPATAITAPDSAVSMVVTHVHDGDTLFLADATGAELKVRLIGVDTPELQPTAECYAVEARNYLQSLAPDGSTLRVAADAEALDQYGRSLFYLWTESGDFLNLRLVADGYGTALRIEPNSAYWSHLVDAERSAQQGGAGMWSGC